MPSSYITTTRLLDPENVLAAPEEFEPLTVWLTECYKKRHGDNHPRLLELVEDVDEEAWLNGHDIKEA